MSNSVMSARDQGPDVPLGLIVVPTPGTPVAIMSLVDSGNLYAPGTPSPAANGTPQGEYSIRCQQLMFQGVKAGAGNNGTQNNTGNIYIVRKGGGSSNRSDYGAIVKTVVPGETFFMGSAATVTDVISPYRYSVDADNANDSALVTMFVY